VEESLEQLSELCGIKMWNTLKTNAEPIMQAVKANPIKALGYSAVGLGSIAGVTGINALAYEHAGGFWGFAGTGGIAGAITGYAGGGGVRGGIAGGIAGGLLTGFTAMGSHALWY